MGGGAGEGNLTEVFTSVGLSDDREAGIIARAAIVDALSTTATGKLPTNPEASEQTGEVVDDKEE